MPMIFLLAFIIISCNNSSTSGNCVNCTIMQKEDSGTISISLTPNSENDSVRIILYNELYNYSRDTSHQLAILKDTFSKSNSLSFKVPLNHDYSVKAVYHSGAKTINAIDGGKFTNQELTGCDNSCWQHVGGSFDVKLKFK